MKRWQAVYDRRTGRVWRVKQFEEFEYNEISRIAQGYLHNRKHKSFGYVVEDIVKRGVQDYIQNVYEYIYEGYDLPHALSRAIEKTARELGWIRNSKGQWMSQTSESIVELILRGELED